MGNRPSQRQRAPPPAGRRGREAESFREKEMKNPPYIGMYGGLCAETAKVIPSVS